MTIINIRGSSGSGKSTLVKMLFADSEIDIIEGEIGDWKKPNILAYETYLLSKDNKRITNKPTYIIGPYRTQCGGCDAFSYKGSHNDIEAMVRYYAKRGNVIFEGLTISSTLTRWLKVSHDFPNQFIWAFMMTSEEECHQRILARNGGREPKIKDGLADYQVKYRGCMKHIGDLKEKGEDVLKLTSDVYGYRKMVARLLLPKDMVYASAFA